MGNVQEGVLGEMSTGERDPICATQSCFVLTHPVTLCLREKTFSMADDFKITCAATGFEYFRCQGKFFSLSKKRVLRDPAGVPILNFREDCSGRNFKVYAGEGSDRSICKFKANTGFNTKMKTDLQDAVSGEMKRVVLKGDWGGKKCVIYYGEPKQGGVPIAKISRPTTTFLGGDNYYLEIAPGVDTALMVTMCLALDALNNTNNNNY